MINKQTIVHVVIAALLVVAVIAAGVSSSRHVGDPVCGTAQIIVKDSTERQYVHAGELQQMLHQAGLWPVGRTLSQISSHEIEQHLLTHPMLRSAECYELAKGEVRIVVRQRQPMMLVRGDEHYYLDTDRKMMPVRASVNTPVVVVSGRIGRQQAEGEMYDFVEWLQDNDFWRDKIRSIRVVTPKMIELTDESDGHSYTIVLGQLTGAEKRMDELQVLYEKGFDKLRTGYPKYKQIDLQYKGQIVGRM